MGNQLEGARPVEAAAALCGIHRFGNTQPEIQQMTAICKGCVPLNCRADTRLTGREGIRDDMGRRKCDAAEIMRAFGRFNRDAGQSVAGEVALRIGERNRGHGRFRCLKVQNLGMTRPPSAERTCPVQNANWPVARAMVMSPISFGCPIRWITVKPSLMRLR